MARAKSSPDALPWAPELLTPGEVAAILRVEPGTVTLWGSTGKLRSVTTPGGRRLYPRPAVDEFLAGGAR